MEKHISHLDPSSSKLDNQEFQPLITRNHLNGDNKDRECATCHLCAIEVPRCFINEHYKSDKHKINKKIAGVALERIQKLLQYNIVGDVDKPESLYFCSPCVIALDSKDRESHEKTVVHKKALTVDKFLYDFYVLYANDDRNSDIERESEAVVLQTNVVQINGTDIPVNIVKNQLISLSEKNAIKIDNVENTKKNVINSGLLKNNTNTNNNNNTVVVLPNVVPVNGTDIPVNIVKNQLMSMSEKIEIKANNVENTKKNVINSGLLKNNTINHIKVENTPNTSTNVVDYSQFCTFEKNKNQTFCKSCKVYIPNKINNLLSHQKGFRHKEVLRKIKKTVINIENK